MAFDPAAYGQMLDEALGYRRPGPPAMGGGMAPMPGPEISPSPPFRESGEGPWAEDLPGTPGGVPMAIDGARQAAAAGPGAGPQTRPGGQVIGAAPPTKEPGRIQGQPPFKLDFKPGAAEKIKDTSDLIDALEPSSQQKYMDWWETQYGAINQRYDDLQRQLGRRPDPKGDLSRKEQFRMLMEFGIELMARAGRGEPGAAGTSFANSYGRARQQKEIDTAEHDARSTLVEKHRSDELKAIGTYGDALKGQSSIEQDAVQMQEARARMKAAGRRKPEIIQADQGTYDYDTETQVSKPILGIDGKPLTNLKVGARGGSAAGRDVRTANQKNIEDLVGRGVPEQLALDIVYRRVTDPRKMWADIYRDRRRQYASDNEAKAEADEIMTRFYGADWEAQPTNAKIDNSDPLGLRD